VRKIKEKCHREISSYSQNEGKRKRGVKMKILKIDYKDLEKEFDKAQQKS